jgi:hypothetical protein
MKKLFFVLCVSILMWNCAPKLQEVTVDELVASVTDGKYVEKDIVLTGKCVHFCEESGKLFIAGDNDENKLVVLTMAATSEVKFSADMKDKMISATGKISAFDPEKDGCCQKKAEQVEETAEPESDTAVVEPEPENTELVPDSTQNAEAETEVKPACTKEIVYKMECVAVKAI